MYTSRRLGDNLPCTQSLGPTCKKLPCKPCNVCGNPERVAAFDGSHCETLAFPTTVVKQEYVAPKRLFTLGAINLNTSSPMVDGKYWFRDESQYGADVGQSNSRVTVLHFVQLMYHAVPVEGCAEDLPFERHARV